MGTTAQKSDGKVDVVVSNEGLSSGWDITHIRANGRALLLKKGEFATQAEAEAAAFERGHAAIKADNTPL